MIGSRNWYLQILEIKREGKIMVIRNFEEIIAWQKAQNLAVEIYRDFGTLDDRGFRNQITRATISISNNIAEGFDRSSDADFKRFLSISKGSANEVKSMLHLAGRLGYITNEKRDAYFEKIIEIRKILSGLIKSLKK
jgi:four helix bundle protein